MNAILPQSFREFAAARGEPVPDELIVDGFAGGGGASEGIEQALELFKAQGFPGDYEIETGVFEDGERRALTKTAQVRICGNSVCPPIAAALVAANCNDMAVATREAAE